MNRVYVLKYNIHINLYSLDEPKIEERIEYFSKLERDKFIKEYTRLKDKHYVQDIETFYAELIPTDMNTIINAI